MPTRKVRSKKHAIASKRRSHKSSRAVTKSLYLRSASALRATAFAVVGLAIIFFALGFHNIILANLSPDRSGSASQLRTNNANQSDTNSAPTSGSTCGSVQQNNPLFAKCPNFVASFTNRKSGSINTAVFNIYDGLAPSNNEKQYYRNNSANVRVESGSLRLEALAQPYGGLQYTSARIDTLGKKDFLYGKLVVRATLPVGIGTWPAIWMLPSQHKYANNTPAGDINRYKNDGEIDIAETVGIEPHAIYGVAHSLAYPEDGLDRSYYRTVAVPDSDTVFHDYELDWTPTSLGFAVDGKTYFTYAKTAAADWRSWPFDQPFYLVINLALGGAWAGSDVANFPTDGIDKGALPATLMVQSIRYFPYTGPH